MIETWPELSDAGVGDGLACATGDVAGNVALATSSMPCCCRKSWAEGVTTQLAAATMLVAPAARASCTSRMAISLRPVRSMLFSPLFTSAPQIPSNSPLRHVDRVDDQRQIRIHGNLIRPKGIGRFTALSERDHLARGGAQLIDGNESLASALAVLRA